MPPFRHFSETRFGVARLIASLQRPGNHKSHRWRPAPPEELRRGAGQNDVVGPRAWWRPPPCPCCARVASAGGWAEGGGGPGACGHAVIAVSFGNFFLRGPHTLAPSSGWAGGRRMIGILEGGGQNGMACHAPTTAVWSAGERGTRGWGGPARAGRSLRHCCALMQLSRIWQPGLRAIG